MQNINLLEALEKAQIEFQQSQILKEAERLLQNEFSIEQSIESRIFGKNIALKDASNFERLEEEKVFDQESIENLCTKYRLRFLTSTMFKGDIPAQAIREVKRVESFYGLKFESFKIIAPEERFNLIDSTKDPILLAELPNGKYYFIFQWGNDLEWYQRFLKYPFQHMGTLAVSSLLVGLIVALIVPSQFVEMKSELFLKFFLFSMTSCLVMTLAIITGIMYSKDFSENVWNSRFIK